MTQPKTPSSSPDRIFAPRKLKGYDFSVAATAPRTASEACGFAMLRAEQEGRVSGLHQGATSRAPAACTALGAQPLCGTRGGRKVGPRPGACSNVPPKYSRDSPCLCRRRRQAAGMEVISLLLSHTPPLCGFQGVIILPVSHQAGNGCRGTFLLARQKDWVG